MRKSVMAIWPRKIREEFIEPVRIIEPERWVQEEEVLKNRLQHETRRPGERLHELLPGLDLKRLVL